MSVDVAGNEPASPCGAGRFCASSAAKPAAGESHRARPWSGPVAARLDGGRVHFQHGPIDLVLEAWGDGVEAAYVSAWRRFEGVLEELVAELPQLRSPVESARDVSGTVARRMVEACVPHAAAFITPMAAVAGAVADEVLQALCAAGNLTRAYVNNGGDIALHLRREQSLRVGVVAEKHKGGARPVTLAGSFEVTSDLPVRGVATSGWRGRSFSRGIADSVTVLATTAAAADAAATMIANAVDVEHPAVRRAPASHLTDDTDLGDRLVTVAVGRLDRAAIDAALDAGAYHARALVARDLAWGAVLLLQGERRVVLPSRVRKKGAHLSLDRLIPG